MKKSFSNLLLFMSVFSMVFLFSCGDDEDVVGPVALAAPSIQISVSAGTSFNDATSLVADGVVIAGDSVFYSVSVTAAGGFNALRLSGGATGEVTRTTLNIDKGTTSTGTLVFGVKTLDTQLGDLVTVTFTAADDQEPSLSSEETFSFTVVAPASPDARIYATQELLAPTGDFTNANFFSVSSGTIYSRDQVNATNDPISATIDFGYYYGDGDNASIASPAGFEGTTFATQVEGWGTKNATVIKTTNMTPAQFIETTTYEDIEAAFDAGTLDENGIVTDLAVGNILAFETVAGVKGLIHVADLQPGFDNKDFIVIDILAQLEAN